MTIENYKKANKIIDEIYAEKENLRRIDRLFNHNLDTLTIESVNEIAVTIRIPQGTGVGIYEILKNHYLDNLARLENELVAL